MTSVRRALALSLVERYLTLAIALGSNMVLARLLTPDQIGVYSVSLAVIGLAQALRDFGVGSYLIQEKVVDDEQIGSAFSISLLIGALLFVVALVATPWAASYYGEPRMQTTLMLGAGNFLLMPFCTISLSLLRREMQFKRLLHITLVAAALGSATSIGLAALGMGETSLALGSLATNAATGVGAWLAQPSHRLPRLTLSRWRQVLSFGGRSSLVGCVTSISMDANDLIVGKVLGFHAVALLSRAQGLMYLFNRDLMSAVRNVALPAFAQAHRDGVDLEQGYLRSVSIVTLFGWPFHGLISCYAIEVIDLLFGRQWHAAAPLVPIFCAAGAFAAVNALTPNLLVAVGRIDLATRADLLMQPLRVLMILIAAIWFRTVQACAVAFMLSALVSLPVFWWFKNQVLEDDRPKLLEMLLLNILITAATLLPALVQCLWAGFDRSQPLALYAWLPTAALGVAAGVLTAWYLRHPLAQEALVQRSLGPWLHRIPVARWRRSATY
ncbi:MAG: lipopolysaccharide biosynthesis protein [Roseateles sp.]|jgi:lipopolysaccharide exporter|nr:lipopolysaccharide biosynthesis protein [Burkholderiaceae bacterium]|mmetsp:Transcript_39186/g.92060  ORF Transcript_39186/g.92060 Transcript_39186/m.92060 type:complete len:498 (+) Transcript_39186:5182-6675(+)